MNRERLRANYKIKRVKGGRYLSYNIELNEGEFVKIIRFGAGNYGRIRGPRFFTLRDAIINEISDRIKWG